MIKINQQIIVNIMVFTCTLHFRIATMSVILGRRKGSIYPLGIRNGVKKNISQYTESVF